MTIATRTVRKGFSYVISSCPEGAGPSPDDGQASTVPGVARAGLVSPRGLQEVGDRAGVGNRWKNGGLVLQKDGTVKFVPPLEPLAAWTISPKFLSEDERIQIADLASRGLGPTAIGQVMWRSPSTIIRELR